MRAALQLAGALLATLSVALAAPSHNNPNAWTKANGCESQPARGDTPAVVPYKINANTALLGKKCVHAPRTCMQKTTPSAARLSSAGCRAQVSVLESHGGVLWV